MVRCSITEQIQTHICANAEPRSVLGCDCFCEVRDLQKILLDWGAADKSKPDVRYSRLCTPRAISCVLKKGGTMSVHTKQDALIRLEREYLIGKLLNQLRPRVPYFVTTHAAFIHRRRLYILTEKITGSTIYQWLRGSKLDFAQWLGVLVQLLIALEVAQRQYGFTHYDLHTSNVLLRVHRKPPVYQTRLSDLDIQVESRFCPVLIDFGLSTIQIDGDVSVGETGKSDAGIFDYSCPAVDMYIFLLSSFWGVKESNLLQRQIFDLFQFFQSDPYEIWSTYMNTRSFACDSPVRKKLELAARDHARLLPISAGAATYTPYKMILWIYSRFAEDLHMQGIRVSRVQVQPGPELDLPNLSFTPGGGLEVLRTGINASLQEKQAVLERHRLEIDLCKRDFTHNPYWDENPVYWVELERWSKALISSIYKPIPNRCQLLKNLTTNPSMRC